MAKKAKEASTIDLFYLGQEEEEEKKKQETKKVSKKTGKTKQKNVTKKKVEKNKDKLSKKADSTYNMEEEIIIGIPKTAVEPKKEKTKKQKKKKSSQKEGSKKSISSDSKKKMKVVQKQPKKNQKLTPKQEKARKRRKKILAITKWLLLVGILLGCLVYFLLSPIFNITEVQVAGNNKISKEQILSLSQIESGDNIFKMRKNKVIEQIKENPYIESVIITRKLPSIVQIEIKERVATLQLNYGNSYVYLNNQGYLLEISEEKLENSPILKGIETKEEKIEPGNRLERKDLEKLESILSILESAKSNEINSITQIDIQKKDDYVLYFEAEDKVVYLGDEKDISTKMLWIKTMLEKEDGKAGELFLNQGMDSIYFREKVS